ncbi:TonB-dependent receptor [Jannaschia marina]|uniref:TonB-dependent receptor n=1 Tax=Jannaschia marina TaxID=2741674 RepID=UPI0015C84B7F|nr:TonB-dependent receptor [Jannaschia marina]
MTLPRSLTLLPVLLCGPALAQQSDEPVFLEGIVIEALRTGATEGSIPGSVQVIDRETILRTVRQGRSLAQALGDRVPGLAPGNGTIGGASQTLRGRTAQILIDGVARTSELRGFDRELATIDPASIERIEIVKGSTARFGNGATGGIINIVTRRPDGDTPRTTVESRLSFQDDDSSSLSNEIFVAHDRRVGDLGLRFELSRRDTGDLFDGAGRLLPSDPIIGQGSRDNTETYSVAVAGDWTRGPHELEFRLDRYRLTQDIAFFTDYSTDPVRPSTRPYSGEDVVDEGASATLTYRHTGSALGDIEISGSITDIDRRAAFVEAGPANFLYYPISPTNLAQDPDAQTELFTRTYGLSATVQTPLDGLGSGATLTWGVDLGRDEVDQRLIDGTDVIAPMTQTSTALFAQLDLSLGDRWEVSGGLRAERFSLSVEDFVRPDAVQLTAGGPQLLPALEVTGGDFDYDAVVGNIGVVFRASDTLDLYAGFSQGFSIPDVGSFTRRARAANPLLPGQTISFASIRPEAQIVDTWEAGLRYSGARLTADGSIFLSTSEDGTVFDNTTNTLTQQEERIWGAELSLDYLIRDGWNAGAQLAFVEGRFDDDDDGRIDSWLPNSRIPAPVTATLYTDYLFETGLALSGELVYEAGRDKGDEPRLEEIVRVNLGGSYPVGSGELTFGVTNLFDTRQDNNTASSVRRDPITGNALRVADEGRRIAIGYAVTF